MVQLLSPVSHGPHTWMVEHIFGYQGNYWRFVANDPSWPWNSFVMTPKEIKFTADELLAIMSHATLSQTGRMP